jgi:hypothetical protein
LSPLVTSTQTVVLQGVAMKNPASASIATTSAAMTSSSRDKFIFTIPSDSTRQRAVTLNHDILPTFNRSLSNTSGGGSPNVVARESAVHTTGNVDYDQLLRDYHQVGVVFCNVFSWYNNSTSVWSSSGFGWIQCDDAVLLCYSRFHERICIVVVL